MRSRALTSPDPIRHAFGAGPDELRAHCREHLAPYKTPAHWVFVDTFPMTPSVKIQKYKLRDSFAQHQPAQPQPG